MDPQQGPPQQDLLIGQTVGNYLVKQRLGEGGMGAVYLAEHPSIGKKVALKVLHAEFATNQEVVERFFNEAKAVNSIAHPNIVDIVDYGVIQTGPRGSDQLVYFIMEYLSGLTLSQTIRNESPLPPERALMISLQVADALSASHRAGIVHRDLKPDNIILLQRGRDPDFVKLLDFGIAKLTADGAGSRTRTGLVLGTPAYMSPEQCEGSAKVDHRTDIYALGICLYEMLVGRVPFIGEGYGEILVQHLTQRPIEPSRYRMMSPHVEQVVLKALEKRPEMRYPSMDEFIRAMADPVGYVESHGGIQGFLSRALTPSTAPLPSRLTPSPLTPYPHTGHMMTPPPGTLTGHVTTPAPTTLGAATGQLEAPRKKTGFVIAGVLVVGAAIAGVAVVLGGGKKESAGTGSGSAEVAIPTTGSGSGVAMTVEHGSAGSAVVTNTGSATVVTNTGSAAVTNTGSAGSAAVVTNTGSAGSAAVVVPPPTTAALTLTSTPDGAEIFINGASIGKKTPQTLTLPRGKVTIAFRLKGYEDLFMKEVALDGDLTKDAALHKAHTGGTGHGSAHTGTGKGSAKACDTCLERPD